MTTRTTPDHCHRCGRPIHCDHWHLTTTRRHGIVARHDHCPTNTGSTEWHIVACGTLADGIVVAVLTLALHLAAR